MKAGEIGRARNAYGVGSGYFCGGASNPKSFSYPRREAWAGKYHHCLRCLPLPGAGGFPPCFHPHPLGAFFFWEYDGAYVQHGWRHAVPCGDAAAKTFAAGKIYLDLQCAGGGLS